jgi:hypothetical protein
MARGLVHTIVIALVAGQIVTERPARAAAAPPTGIVERFLSLIDSAATEYRALRHMDAQNGPNRTAWMDVWTEVDRDGRFRYTVAAEGGSGYIRSKIFRGTLESEEKLYASGESDRAALTSENYVFEEEAPAGDGLSTVLVTPRRKDVMLIDGAIFLQPESADLVRIEGQLAKSPSFWIRQVHVVHSFDRIAGARMPVALEAVANIRFAGKATFRMTYEYEMVNGRAVGAPQLRARRGE